MEKALAPLRRDLDIFPSADRQRPGLVIQDRSRFSDRMIVVPPALVAALELFNGHNTDLDLRALLTRITGELQVSELAENLQSALSSAGFLQDEAFEKLRELRLRQWRESDELLWSHSGPLSYPDEAEALRVQFDTWFGAPGHAGQPVSAIAAPHASPGAAQRSYVAAYRQLTGSLTREAAADKVFVILGTSHYGEMDRLGTTRKDFVTPVGKARVEGALLSELKSAGGAGVIDEDYYFKIEHSVEFQVVFLQYLFGPSIRILPLLCGSFARSIYFGGEPEDSEQVRRYLDALRGMEEKHRNQLVWVLGVDMAHMGKRYEDGQAALAYQGRMLKVEERDRQRIAALQNGEADRFWSLVQEGNDDLKWCGSAPFYTYLKTVPRTQGELLSYEHWQIDPGSVVTYGAMRFAH